jgi:hypothetical protein
MSEKYPLLAAEEKCFYLTSPFIDPDGLMKVIHHFAEPHIGMVQTRWTHLNRDYSILTQIEAILLDGHFVLEHGARARAGEFFNFNGTAGMWRRHPQQRPADGDGQRICQ